MKQNELEKAVEGGIRFLEKFFPSQTYLYFPLLSSAVIWAIKRPKQWRENILSWKVWPDPGFVAAKPDEFIRHFFRSKPALSRAFDKELERKNTKPLRQAFSSLYPLLGLEDPFLSALFYEELERGDFEKIVEEFEPRVKRAVEDIQAADSHEEFLSGLKSVASELGDLGLDLFSQSKVQKALAEIIKKALEEKK